jgi:hypothetical protein
MTVSNQSSGSDIPEGSGPAEPSNSHRDLIKPDEDGLMPLFDAVYWIASEGHTKTVDGSAWDNAARAMAAALHRARLLATGTRRGGGRPEKIPAVDWQGVVIDRLNNEPYLLLVGPAGDHRVHGGEYQDQLFMVNELRD